MCSITASSSLLCNGRELGFIARTNVFMPNLWRESRTQSVTGCGGFVSWRLPRIDGLMSYQHLFQYSRVIRKSLRLVPPMVLMIGGRSSHASTVNQLKAISQKSSQMHSLKFRFRDAKCPAVQFDARRMRVPSGIETLDQRRGN
jgi:hypothetical protein